MSKKPNKADIEEMVVVANSIIQALDKKGIDLDSQIGALSLALINTAHYKDVSARDFGDLTLAMYMDFCDME